ncbi:persephin [Cheilinus undulatus]|uniref:persephin n=1 Tax=Cheilinus undulatus TaxID=241271 RepID=UPI001BD32DB4|nr:persephin [Cheilinus undulatus]
MMLLLKLVVILLCVWRGEGRWLSSLIDQKQGAASPHFSPNVGMRNRDPAADTQSKDSGARPSHVPIRSRRSTFDSQCGLRSILLQVRDLGLGYDSDETVLFKYCGGACPHARSNHDLTLTNLLLSGVLPQPAPGELWHNAPCCRPTHHEDMAFLDNSHRWHKVEKLLAAGCSCVG